MPRIIVLFEYPTLFGGERSMLSVLSQFDQADIAAIAPPVGRLADALRNQRIPLLPLTTFDETKRRRPRADVLHDLSALVDHHRPDLLHANSLSMGVLTGQLGGPMRRSAHIRDIMSLSRNATRLLNQNDRLLAVSAATRCFHIRQGVEADKLLVVYNGADTNLFTPDRSGDRVRRELGLSEDHLLSLTIGQIGLRKGLDVLVQAIIDAARNVPQLQFAIVGERLSGKQESIEYESALRAAVQDAGLTSRVHWLGYRTDVPDLMAAADMLVHAAHQEPLGRVLLEAAAAGLPIVATNVGGTAEIVDHGISALLVPAADPAALSSAIVQLARQPHLRSTLAAAARDRATQRFSHHRAAAALWDAWQPLLR